MAENHHSEVDEILQGYLLDNVEVAGRELGVGSYSSVVEMRYKGMKCAGKRIHQSLYEQGVAVGPEILDRFGTECELLSEIRHPHIVQFLGLHFEDNSDVPILVLEFMSAALSDCIEQYRVLPNEISYSILHDVALGLHYLHDRTPVIIHRDLTANNVLLTAGMTAKISDLGMAKILNLPPAQMTRRMTICPGTISYMPPEALTADPLYDTKLDGFSFGVLMVHVFCGEWPLALEYLQKDPKKPGHLYPLTEIERRDKYFKKIGPNHPLLGLIHRCLRNIPSERPTSLEILTELSTVATRFPPSYRDRVQMLRKIQSDLEEKEQLQGELDQLRKMLHEKEHEIENLRFTYGSKLESTREQITRVEQQCAIQEAQIAELQAENGHLRSTLAPTQEELESVRKKADQLTHELQSANGLLQERSRESLQKLQQLQSEVTSRSQAREEALHSLARGQLETSLKKGMHNKSHDELSRNFEEFFLTNADEIADLVKRSPDVKQFQAQQLVCEMVQQSYAECKALIMDEIQSQLEKLFVLAEPGPASGPTPSPKPDSAHQDGRLDGLHDTRVAYGLLLRAVELRQKPSPPPFKPISQKVFRSLLRRDGFQKAPRDVRTALQKHVDKACELVWKLITVTPPPIVSQPQKFREEWQDREFEYWDKKKRSSTKLLYTRPVLFQSYAGRVGVKGWVGNRDTMRLSPPKECRS